MTEKAFNSERHLVPPSCVKTKAKHLKGVSLPSFCLWRFYLPGEPSSPFNHLHPAVLQELAQISAHSSPVFTASFSIQTAHLKSALNTPALILSPSRQL